MADNQTRTGSAPGAAYFKEAVCIDAGRVFDSASDKDCLEDLQVFFSAQTQCIVDQAAIIKVKSAEVIDVYLSVEPIPFNKGFYAVDLTFFFQVELNALSAPNATPVPVIGLSCFSKKVILYGSEGNVKVFSSDTNRSVEEAPSNMPTASISVVDPICLGCRLIERCNASFMESAAILPESITNHYEGDFQSADPQKVVLVTLGMFTIVKLSRNVQMLVPVYDYCIPDRESTATTSIPAEDPCELFKRIKFPTKEFFPNSDADISMPCENTEGGDC